MSIPSKFLYAIVIGLLLVQSTVEAQKLSDVVLWDNDTAYLFYESGQYIRFDVKADKAVDDYPKSIADNWEGVWDSGIDAALTWKDGKAYFFKGSQYIRYDIAKDKADDGYPADISTFWNGLWDHDIDAAVKWNAHTAFFFKGDEVIEYSVDDDRKVNKSHITDVFPGLWSSGIDAAVVWNNGFAYFFKGDRYVKWDIAHKKVFDNTYPRFIKDNWRGVGDNQAAYFGWHGSADTNLLFSDFFDHDHTIVARFMPQYQYAYGGPILAENGSGDFHIGQGNFETVHDIDAVIVVPKPLPITPQAYFFRDDMVLQYDLLTTHKIGNWKRIKTEWPGVWEKRIDTAMVLDGKAFFFKHDEFIEVDLSTRRAKPSRKIKDMWPGVWPSDIDAAVVWTKGKIVFFKGDKYQTYDIDSKQALAEQTIKDHWPGLFKHDVNAGTIWNNGKAYFFHGAKYVSFDVDDHKADGAPEWISDRFEGVRTNVFPQFMVKIGSQERLYNAPNLVPGNWVHLAVVRAHNTFKIYLDATAIDQITIDPNDNKLPRGRANLRLGRRTDGSPDKISDEDDDEFEKLVNGKEGQFYGFIDDVAVFKRALTRDQIDLIRQNPEARIRSDDPTLAGAWNFADRQPEGVMSQSRIIFNTLSVTKKSAGVSLVSESRSSPADRGLLPLPFQKASRQLPFKPNQIWTVIQGMNDPLGSHMGSSAFSLDFHLVRPQTPLKVVNPNFDAISCGEPVLASAAGKVILRRDNGSTDPNVAKSDFDGPNVLYVENARGEYGSYMHLFTGSISRSIPNEFEVSVKLEQKVGEVGTLNGCHLHIGVFGDLRDNGVNYPQEFSDYEVSRDEGKTWRKVLRGSLRVHDWIRRREH